MSDGKSFGSGLEYMVATKYQNLQPSDQQLGKAASYPDTPVIPGAVFVELGPPSEPDMPLIDALRRRRSLRQYSDQDLTLSELSFLLWSVHGLVKKGINGGSLRTSPSAGARHPLDTYVLVNRVRGVVPGLYVYIPESHSLAEVDLSQDVAGRMASACMGQSFIQKAAVSFAWAARAYRVTYRYGERGYRYMHLDAGHACQNLYLAAEAVGAGCCAVAAFDDDEMNQVLGLDGVDAFTIYVASVGKRE